MRPDCHSCRLDRRGKLTSHTSGNKGKGSPKELRTVKPINLRTAFAALKRAQEQRNQRTYLLGTDAAVVDESDDDLSETLSTTEADLCIQMTVELLMGGMWHM